MTKYQYKGYVIRERTLHRYQDLLKKRARRASDVRERLAYQEWQVVKNRKVIIRADNEDACRSYVDLHPIN